MEHKEWSIKSVEGEVWSGECGMWSVRVSIRSGV